MLLQVLHLESSKIIRKAESRPRRENDKDDLTYTLELSKIPKTDCARKQRKKKEEDME